MGKIHLNAFLCMGAGNGHVFVCICVCECVSVFVCIFANTIHVVSMSMSHDIGLHFNTCFNACFYACVGACVFCSM